jgi:hypothetical protein
MSTLLSSTAYHGPLEELLEHAEELLTKAVQELVDEGYETVRVQEALEAVQRASDIYQDAATRYELQSLPATEEEKNA